CRPLPHMIPYRAFFFFSSRRRHTRWPRDWSSVVCSSDLQLNVAEAATRADLPKAPAFYNPRTHPERAVRRRNLVLGLMRERGFLTPEESELWRSYPLVLTANRTNYGDVAPYFVEWLRVQLDARFGRDLYDGGLRIYTT